MRSVTAAALMFVALSQPARASFAVQTIEEHATRFSMKIEYPRTGNAAIDADIAGFAKGFADGFRPLKNQAAENAYLPEGGS
jgi:hypothetical protein